MLTDNAAGEWQEEVRESCLTPEEELIETNEYLQRALKENMDLHNRLRDMRELVDSLQKQLAALEEKLKAQEKNSSDVIEAARLLRIKLKDERDDLRQEVLNLQHSLAVERQRLESLDVGSAEQPETEVEKLARELFSRIPDVSVESSFYAAQSWIVERNRRRKESSK